MNLFTAWLLIGFVSFFALISLVAPSQEARQINATIAAVLGFATLLLAVLL